MLLLGGVGVAAMHFFTSNFYHPHLMCVLSFRARREGEGQRTRNRIVQKMKHRESLRQKAIENGESVEDWDRIVLVGKKIKQPAAASASASEESS